MLPLGGPGAQLAAVITGLRGDETQAAFILPSNHVVDQILSTGNSLGVEAAPISAFILECKFVDCLVRNVINMISPPWPGREQLPGLQTARLAFYEIEFFKNKN